ncbi:rRNA processing domain containing protein, putative [Babesia caballi]|uniref:rRNA processing domain containing protein, putative n=1 Tax=Babesia caballi TaxID=5871 RepID=A0AAV4M1C2_BABCB|nr:rRNA processing domain containing protein, putative [Babesia caballi]
MEAQLQRIVLQQSHNFALRKPVGGRGIAEDGVKVIKPQIETVYYVHGASGKGFSGGAGTAGYEEAGSDEEDEESVDGGYDDGDASDDTGVAQETTARARKEAVDTELADGEGSEEAQSVAESEDDSDGGLPSPKRRGMPRVNKEADGHIGVGKKGAKLGKRGREWEEEEGGTESKTGGKASGRQKGKYSGVYAKALKLREEQIKVKQQLHNERIEKIKQKKREIREKKQERYARHRLLGKKTKRGQPIMANVISHLMNNFQKKQR